MPSEEALPHGDQPPTTPAPEAPIRRRLHPVSPLFGIATLLRQFAIPAILVIFFARGEAWQGWLLIPFTILLGAELVRYLTLTYYLAPGELVIRHGLLSRTDRQIPYERVQNVELVQNAVHRLLGVAEVRLQTGGGAELDAHLRVVSTGAVEELRRAVLAARRQPQETEATPTVVLRLPLKEIVLHGLLTGRGMVVLAAAIGLLWEFDIDVMPMVERLLPEGTALWREAVERSARPLLLWVLVFVPALIVLRLLAAAWAVVRLYDFTLGRTGDGLQSRYGLLTRVSATIPRARVQVITVLEGVWHRWLQRAAVRVDTAGRFAQEGGNVGSQWVAPIVGRGRLDAIVREVQPDAEVDPAGWQAVDRRARARIIRRRLATLIVLALLLTPVLGSIVVVAAFALAALGVWQAHRLTRRLAVALTPTSIVIRTGAFAYRLSMARFARIQSVSCFRTPFDRRWRMATISVDTAGTPAEHRIVVPYLPEDAARAIYERLRAEVAHGVRGAGL